MVFAVREKEGDLPLADFNRRFSTMMSRDLSLQHGMRGPVCQIITRFLAVYGGNTL